MESFPPRLYLIGAQKAGTTFFAGLLSQHPHIELSAPKEPHFYSAHWEKGLDWYRERFSSPDEGTLLDASTSYSMAPLSEGAEPIQDADDLESVPGRLAEERPDAEIVYILREPVARAYSGYWHNVRTGREARDFRAAVEENPYYLDVSDYAGQLELWDQHFDISRFQFLTFERMVDDPEGAVVDCLDGVGIEASRDEFSLDESKNPSAVAGPVGRSIYGGIAKLATRYPTLGAWRDRIWESLPSTLRSPVRRVLRGSEEVPEIDPAVEQELRDDFRPRVHEAEDVTGLELMSVWNYD